MEEHRLRLLQNRVLRNIFGPNWGDTIGGWSKLYNEELCNLYSLPNVIRMIMSRRMRWAGCVPRMVEQRTAYRILVGKLEGKSPLGRPRHRWVDNDKMDLRQRGWGGMNWIDLVQERDQLRTPVNKAINFRVPWNIGNFFSNWAIGNFSRRS
jgi:hypothetical protein